MKATTIRRLAHAMGGRIIADPTFAPAAISVDNISTDSRKPPVGGAFFALSGPNFDGHDFVAVGLRAGATAAIVAARHILPDGTPSGPLADLVLPPETCLIAVADPQRALEDLARAVRNAHPGRFVAITGSVGKTTIKNMLAAALTPFGPCAATPGNLNNHIGLPLTLGLTRGDERHVVLELGMSAAGEIAHLTNIARPDVGVVCAAAAAHLAAFDSVDGIADAKCELFEHLPSGATAIANADDPRIIARARRIVAGPLITWGRHPDATIRVISTAHVHDADGVALAVEISVSGQPLHFKLRVIGDHNALNAAAALAACHALGLPLDVAATALASQFRPAPHRLESIAVRRGLTILDDAYNANPASMAAALDTVSAITDGLSPRPRLALVLGTMHELGPESPALHAAMGRHAAKLAPALVVATGPEAAQLLAGLGETPAPTLAVADVADAAPILRAFAEDGSSPALLLLKGSRAERLERVIDMLREAPMHPDGGA